MPLYRYPLPAQPPPRSSWAQMNNRINRATLRSHGVADHDRNRVVTGSAVVVFSAAPSHSPRAAGSRSSRLGMMRSSPGIQAADAREPVDCSRRSTGRRQTQACGIRSPYAQSPAGHRRFTKGLSSESIAAVLAHRARVRLLAQIRNDAQNLPTMCRGLAVSAESGDLRFAGSAIADIDVRHAQPDRRGERSDRHTSPS